MKRKGHKLEAERAAEREPAARGDGEAGRAESVWGLSGRVRNRVRNRDFGLGGMRSPQGASVGEGSK